MPKKKPANKSKAKAKPADTTTDDASPFCDVIEAMAIKMVMLEPDDLPEMAGLCKELGELAEKLAGSGLAYAAETSEAAKNAGSLVENIILRDTDDADGDMQKVGKLISFLQEKVCLGGDGSGPANTENLDGAPDVESGDEQKGEVLTSDSKTDSSSAAPGASALPASIDMELFEPFLEQQESVLPDIEKEILAYEEDGNSEHIDAIRRTVHTMKGEAGVCGIEDVGALCHKLEDYLQEGIEGQKLSLDLLFKVNDCFTRIIQGYREGHTVDCSTKLMAELDKALGSEVEAEAKREDVETSATEPAGEGPTFDPVSIADPELASDFVSESQEHFDIADENLLTLEDDPSNKDAVNAVFRAFHTIKGVSGFIGLTPIGALAHKAENLLDDVRKGNRSFAGSAVDVTFKGLDMLKLMMSDLGEALTSGSDFVAPPELGALIVSLEKVLAGEELEDAPPPPEPAKAKPAEAAPAAQPDADAPAAGVAGKATQIRSIMKVDAEKIDLLLDTIGELVIAESIVSGDPEISALDSQNVQKNLAHLGKITRSLQDMGMAMRLVPVEATFRKMARLVRDLSKKSGKKIEFKMEGQDTEVDKGMVDKLGDPLVHMIRNSVDHGVEGDVSERVAAGKSEEGHVTLKAYHQGGSIHIEIVDDGKGLDKEAILEKAIERGLIDSGDGMSDQEIFSLIFAAGFSTAKQITEVSGRGVGMDVVRRNIEGLRGQIKISSEKGVGTTFTIVLPLTMAIIDGMHVRVGNETYIIPTLSIVESLRPKREMITSVQGKGQMIKFRDRLLPLFYVSKLFDVKEAVSDPCGATVVILEDSGRQTGLVVDELLGQQQTVIKSMGDAIGSVDGVAGACIMADGKPGLILDVSGILALATKNASRSRLADKEDGEQSGSDQ